MAENLRGRGPHDTLGTPAAVPGSPSPPAQLQSPFPVIIAWQKLITSAVTNSPWQPCPWTANTRRLAQRQRPTPTGKDGGTI
jgi:hypothetical protein